MARGGGARAPCGVAARPSRGAPHRRSSAGGPERWAAIRRVDALSGLDRHGTIHWSDRGRLQQLARRGEVASQVLPDLWIVAGDGAACRSRTLPPASPLLRLLRHALALRSNNVSLLPSRHATAFRNYRRRR